MAEPYETSPTRILDFDQFPICFSVIRITKPYMFFRASSTILDNDTVPKFFANFDTAKKYTYFIPTPTAGEVTNQEKSTFRNLFGVVMKNNTTLMDVRMMRSIVQDTMIHLIKNYEPELIAKSFIRYEDQNGNIEKIPIREAFKILEHVYGLRSLYDQKRRRPLDDIGYRSSYGGDDNKAVCMMKTFLYPRVSGYIAPKMLKLKRDGDKRVFFHPEIVLFDTSNTIDKSKTQTIFAAPNPPLITKKEADLIKSSKKQNDIGFQTVRLRSLLADNIKMMNNQLEVVLGMSGPHVTMGGNPNVQFKPFISPDLNPTLREGNIITLKGNVKTAPASFDMTDIIRNYVSSLLVTFVDI